MKKLFLLALLFCNSLFLFAFPNIVVTEMGQEFIKIQDDEVFMFFNSLDENGNKQEHVKHYFIDEALELYDDENNKAGFIEDCNETYLISFSPDSAGFSHTVEFSKDKLSLTKVIFFQEGYQIYINEYDEYGRISKVDQISSSFICEYYGLSTKIKSIKFYEISVKGYTLMKFDEDTGNYIYSARYEDDEVKEEYFYEYYENTDICKKETIYWDDSSIWITEYSKKGQKISYIVKNSIEPFLKNNRYEYDSKGNLIRTYYLDEDDCLKMTVEETYNSQNKVVTKIKTNEETGDVEKDVYEYDSDNITLRKCSTYLNDKLESVTEYPLESEGSQYKVYDYSSKDYFRVTTIFDWNNYSNYTEIYEIEEGKVAFYTVRERSSIDIYIRIKTYSPENKLLGWEYFELDDNYKEKTAYKFSNGKIVYIKEFDENGNLINCLDFDSASNKEYFEKDNSLSLE